MYLGPKQYGNFKPEPNPNKPKKERAADKRPGMSPEHLTLIRQLPCCVCGQSPPSDPHHLKIKSERGVGLKATDRWTLPMCREHHNEIEKVGTTEAREEAWFLKHGISCFVLARAFWNAPRRLESYIKVLEGHRK